MDDTQIRVGDLIFADIDDNEYLNELYDQLLYNYALHNLMGAGARDAFESVDVVDALRFADLLSKSTHPKFKERHRLWAQEIAILCSVLYPDDPHIGVFVSSVFTTIGNYAALKHFGSDQYLGVFDEAFDRYQYEYLRIPGRDDIRFLAPQKQAFDRFGKEAFSFSAPTSLGKSFLMKTFITSRVKAGHKGNYAIVVPTKALINETRSELIESLADELGARNYCVVTSANDIALEGEHNYIFVLTAERLLYLLISKPGIDLDYLFIDEAHKLAAIDSRSTFYYQVISILNNRQRKPRFIFASPNIPNPEVFLATIDKDKGLEDALHTEYAPVAQFKFIIDFKKKAVAYYNDRTQSQRKIAELPPQSCSLESLVHSLSVDHTSQQPLQTLVYHSSRHKAVTAARNYAQYLPVKQDERLEGLAASIERDIHNDYYLANLVRKGVAYHIGYLPPSIRERIEELFREKVITTMFCTSTLLEGVNLPADNLVFTAAKNGMKNLRPIDFKNLLGRVGRIRYNLYGNVYFLINNQDKTSPDYTGLLEKPVEAQTLSIATDSAGFRKIDKERVKQALLKGEPYTVDAGENQQSNQMIRKFSLILLRDIEQNRKSIVRDEFNLTVDEEDQIREAFAAKRAQQDDDINISIDQAENIEHAVKEEHLFYPQADAEGRFDYGQTVHFLDTLADKYKWDIYEPADLGKKDDKDTYSLLRWYAVILLQWMEGHGLNYIMKLALQYRAKHPETFWNPATRRLGYNDWDLNDRNMVMNDVLSVIEQILLFKLSNYFLRLSNEYKQARGVEHFDNDWYEYVEYGTTNNDSITLQRYGFTRESSTYIRQNLPNPVISIENRSHLNPAILELPNEDVRREAQEIKYNLKDAFPPDQPHEYLTSFIPPTR